MTHALHLPHWSSSADGEEPGLVPSVHRIGAVVVAAVIAAFGVLGLVNGLAYFSTDGQRVAGLSSNGLLSTISLVTALVLVVAAFRSSRVASTTMLVIGVLFLVSHQPGRPVTGWRSARYWSRVRAWQTSTALLFAAFSVP